MPAPRQPMRPGDPRQDGWLLGLRADFLATVDRIAPDMPGSLLDELGPPFAALAEVRGLDPDRINAAPTAASLHRTPEGRAMVEAMRAWAAPCGLDRDPWVADALLRCLWVAAHLGTVAPVSLVNGAGSVAYWVPGAVDAPYRPDRESWTGFLRRMEARREATAAAGWADAPYLPHRARDLDWLVRRVVRRWTWDAIRAAAAAHSPDGGGPDLRTVRRAVQAMAKLLPITL